MAENIGQVFLSSRADFMLVKSNYFCFSQESEKEFAEGDILIGTFRSGGNHWTAVIIDLIAKTFLFMDPKGDIDIDAHCARQYCSQWTAFSRIWNRECASPKKLPEVYTPKWLPHDRQGTFDNNNCGIYTLTVRNHFSCL